jgi:hypothetical protein
VSQVKCVGLFKRKHFCASAVMLFVVGTSALWQVSAAPQSHAPTRLIDGAANPELIPDWRAYRILFRFISNRTGAELVAIKGYLRELGLGGENCVNCSVNPTRESVQIENLLAIAEAFSSRERELDLDLKKKLDENASANEESEFAQLGKQKEKLWAEFVPLLNGVLGSADAEKVRLHVQRMKPHVKIVE